MEHGQQLILRYCYCRMIDNAFGVKIRDFNCDK